MATQEEIINQLKTVIYPNFNKNIVDFNFVTQVTVHDGNKKAAIRLDIPSANPEHAAQLRSEIESKIKAIGIEAVEIDIKQPEAAQPQQQQQGPQAGQNLAPQIKSFIMVSSGKGGVGKSTTSVNLAVALAMQGKKVGLLDCDIYGPNVPRMMGIRGTEPKQEGNKLLPMQAYGVEVMSLGVLYDDDTSLIWRGPMVMRAVTQLLRDVLWGELDTLVIDMPPGTGDAQLTLAQSIPVTAGVTVTTPQKVSLDDSKRSLDMLQKLHVPIAGIVENMSGFICPDTGKEYDIFGKGTTQEVADLYNTEVLGEIPIEPQIREGGDEGKPVVYFQPDSHTAKAYMSAADKLWKIVEIVLEDGLSKNDAIQPQPGPSACSTH